MFSVERSDPRRVLFIHEANDSRSPLYFRSALASAAEGAFALETAAWTRRRTRSLPNMLSSFCPTCCLCPPALEAEPARLCTRRGKRPDRAGYLGGTAATHSRSCGEHPGRRTITPTLRPALPDGGRSRPHATPRSPSPTAGPNVEFYFAVAADTTGARVVARLTDGTPLLVEKKLSEGRVLLFTSGLDNLTNDFPLHPIFVPFVEQTARYLSGMEQRSGSRVVDSFFELRSDKDRAARRGGGGPRGAPAPFSEGGRHFLQRFS